MFFEMIANGSHSSCPAPSTSCTCEKKLYTTTGTLALIAGFTQCVVGYYYSMAVLSDSVHAVGDSFADYILAFVVFMAWRTAGGNQNSPKATIWRKRGNKANAFLLAGGALLVLYEAYDRIGQPYDVFLPAVFLAGILGVCIDLARLRTLLLAKGHYDSDNIDGAIGHAYSDAVHSMWVSIAAGLGLAGHYSLAGDGYTLLLRCADQLASVFLALWMMFILAPKIWRGKGCCSGKYVPGWLVRILVPKVWGGSLRDKTHTHGPGCKHGHH